jgi:hypothetical protein
MNMGRLHLFCDRKTGAVDLDITAQLKDRQAMFKYVVYKRTGATPVDLTLVILVPGWGEFTIREQLGFSGSYWVFREPFELPAGGYARITTTGAAGGEDHTACVVIEEMDQ